MIQNDKQLQVTLDRIRRLLEQVAHLRRTETNAENYRALASGLIAEIDRMQFAVRQYMTAHPDELASNPN